MREHHIWFGAATGYSKFCNVNCESNDKYYFRSLCVVRALKLTHTPIEAPIKYEAAKNKKRSVSDSIMHFTAFMELDEAIETNVCDTHTLFRCEEDT